MDRIEAVKQAFIMAYNGYIEATFEVERVRTAEGMQRLPTNGRAEPFALSQLAPVAAEIYRQLTGRLIVEVGSEKRLPEPRTLERIQEQIQNAGLSPDLVASYDIKLRQLDNEQVIRIIVEAPGGEVTEKDET